MTDLLRIEEALSDQGVYVGTTVGVSMWPMLRNRRDTIIVEPPAGRLRKFDVPLYRRGDAYVLHRVVEVLPDSYVILGDNCLQKEHGITDEQIIGVLTGFYRGNKQKSLDSAGYRAYVRVWYGLYPVRRVCMRARAKAARVWHKLTDERGVGKAGGAGTAGGAGKAGGAGTTGGTNGTDGGQT